MKKNNKILTAIVTAGPTIERIDPVRYISNFSSGKQGFSIANALYNAGIQVKVISGPVNNIMLPESINCQKIESAAEMLSACEKSLPVDIAVCVAAVCDWRPKIISKEKLKKHQNEDELDITLVKNPDILSIISHHKLRPKLVIGFAAETNNLIDNAKIKLQTKGCDWICANDVSNGILGGDYNEITLVTDTKVQLLGKSTKKDLAEKLVEQILYFFTNQD